MHVMRLRICVDRFKFGRMAHNLDSLSNAIAPMHVSANPGDIQSFAAIVAFHQANELWAGRAVVHHLTQSEGRLQTQRNFGLHIGQLFLEQLGLRQRLVELLSVQTLLQFGVPTKLCFSHNPPVPAIAGPLPTTNGPR